MLADEPQPMMRVRVTEQWAQQLAGAVRLAKPDRVAAVEELTTEGFSAAEIGATIGVSKRTVERDRAAIKQNTPSNEGLDGGATAEKPSNEGGLAVSPATKTRQENEAKREEAFRNPFDGRLPEGVHFGDFRELAACHMTDRVRSCFPDRRDFNAIENGSLLNGEIKTVHPFAASHWGEQGSEEVPIHYAARADASAQISAKGKVDVRLLEAFLPAAPGSAYAAFLTRKVQAGRVEGEQRSGAQRTPPQGDRRGRRCAAAPSRARTRDQAT